MAERRIINGYIVEKGDDGQIRTIGRADGGQGGGPQMPADPSYQYEAPKAQADLQARQIGNQVDAATAPYAGSKAAADAQSAQANAALAALKLKQEQEKAAKAGGPSSASDAILKVISQIDNIASDAKDNGGLGETGFTGSQLRGWSGTAAYDLAQKLKTVDANLAFGELQKMRDNSPTGGALGNVTENELALLRSTVSNLDPNQSQEEFLAALGRARDSYVGMLTRVAPDLSGRLSQEYRKRGDPLAGYALTGAADGPAQDSILNPAGGRPATEQDNAALGPGDKFLFDESGAPIAIQKADGSIGGYSQIIGADQRDDMSRDTTMGAIDALGRGLTDVPTLGGANKFAAAMNTILPLDALAGRDVQSVWGGQSLGDAYRHNIGLENRTDAADERVNAGQRLTGQLGGALLSGYGAAKAFPGVFGTEMGMLAPRAIGADAAMGGIYGANKALDQGEAVLPAAGRDAAAWAGGGILGRGVANIGGRAISGVTNPSVQNLRSAGVPMSPGQMVSQSGMGITGNNLAGSVLKSAEDVAVGAGPLGAGFRAQRDASLEGLNRAAFNEGMAPVGGNITEIGAPGVMQARQARGQGYSNALDNANLTADLPFVRNVNDIAKGADNIKGMEGEFRATLADRVGGQFDKVTRSMGGRDLQAAIRGLRTDAKAADRSSNFMRSDQFGNATRSTEAELMALAERQNPGISAGYDAANKANMNYEILRKAVRAAKNQDDVFSAAQLRTAADQAAEKFGGRGGTPDVPFYQLTKDAQAILPSKMADSGTAGRSVTMALPLLVGGGSSAAAGAGYIDPQTAAMLTALTALSSKTGRSAAEKALLARPAVAKRAGKAIRKRSGLFGAVAGPAALIGTE